jgi:hypothetical protein
VLTRREIVAKLKSPFIIAPPLLAMKFLSVPATTSPDCQSHLQDTTRSPLRFHRATLSQLILQTHCHPRKCPISASCVMTMLRDRVLLGYNGAVCLKSVHVELECRSWVVVVKYKARIQPLWDEFHLKGAIEGSSLELDSQVEEDHPTEEKSALVSIKMIGSS